MITRLIAWLVGRFRKHPPLDRRWDRHVDRAEQDRRRFQKAVDKVKDPAIKSSLATIGTRLDTAVETVRTVATHGQEVQEALAALPNRSFLEHELENLRARGLADADSRVQAAQFQLDTIDKIRARVAEVEERLEKIDADLDLSVARAVEADVNSVDDRVLEDLRGAVDRAVSELDALNTAIIEVRDIA